MENWTLMNTKVTNTPRPVRLPQLPALIYMQSQIMIIGGSFSDDSPLTCSLLYCLLPVQYTVSVFCELSSLHGLKARLKCTRNWVSPTPSFPSDCAPPPEPKGGAHSPGGLEVGESQFRRPEIMPSTLPTLFLSCSIPLSMVTSFHTLGLFF
jgi:hypothetical protein